MVPCQFLSWGFHTQAIRKLGRREGTRFEAGKGREEVVSLTVGVLFKGLETPGGSTASLG